MALFRVDYSGPSTSQGSTYLNLLRCRAAQPFPNTGAGQTRADEERMFCYSGPTEENGFFLSLDDSLNNLALTCSIPLSHKKVGFPN